MGLKELFDAADRIGNKYQSPEEIAEQEAKLAAIQEKARSLLTPQELEELGLEAVRNTLTERQ